MMLDYVLIYREQTINHYITYGVITAKPELSYTSVLSTIRLYSITSGDLEGSTFVEWTGNFSSDADAGKSRSLYCTVPCHSVIDGDQYADRLPRCHPGCQVQAPRCSGRSGQDCYQVRAAMTKQDWRT